jgi:hypothetical protein
MKLKQAVKGLVDLSDAQSYIRSPEVQETVCVTVPEGSIPSSVYIRSGSCDHWPEPPALLADLAFQLRTMDMTNSSRVFRRIGTLFSSLYTPADFPGMTMVRDTFEVSAPGENWVSFVTPRFTQEIHKVCGRSLARMLAGALVVMPLARVRLARARMTWHESSPHNREGNVHLYGVMPKLYLEFSGSLLSSFTRVYTVGWVD